MILELKNIDKSFGEKEVLKGVSFTAEDLSMFFSSSIIVFNILPISQLRPILSCLFY